MAKKQTDYELWDKVVGQGWANRIEGPETSGTEPAGPLEAVQSISAVTLMTADMAASVAFYVPSTSTDRGRGAGSALGSG